MQSESEACTPDVLAVCALLEPAASGLAEVICDMYPTLDVQSVRGACFEELWMASQDLAVAAGAGAKLVRREGQ